MLWKLLAGKRELSSARQKAEQGVAEGWIGARAYLLCSMWDLPGTGLKPMSLALAGGFLTTAPPGKPLPV